MKKIKYPALSSGLAMFSMFFGAGNITFPLIIGLTVKGNLFYALLGLILTAVVIPFSGLLAITLFEGDYKKFFERVGKIPGYAIILILLALIGPFGGIPRLITLTYSTLKIYFSGLGLIWFSLCGSILIFLFCWKRNRIIDLIGYILSPVLLFFLFTIVIKGLFFSQSGTSVPGVVDGNPFLYGLKEGYNTMDLLAAFFFSSLIYQRLKTQIGDNPSGSKTLLLFMFKASLIGATLLSTIYIGFSYVAASYRGSLSGIPLDQILGSLGHVVLGPYAGLVVSMSIALTCLTTAIALTAICSEFLQKQILKDKLRYEWCLLLILGISLLVSTLEFSGIVRLLSPVLQVLYPALLGLSLFNILHKLFNFKPIKIPVFAIFFVFLLNNVLR